MSPCPRRSAWSRCPRSRKSSSTTVRPSVNGSFLSVDFFPGLSKKDGFRASWHTHSLLTIPVRAGSEDAFVETFHRLDVFGARRGDPGVRRRGAAAAARAAARSSSTRAGRAPPATRRGSTHPSARPSTRELAALVDGPMTSSLYDEAPDERRSASRPTSAGRSPTSSRSRPTRRRGRQEILTAKSDTTPPDFERGVLDVIAKSGVAGDDIALPRARDDARDQRDHRAEGRQDGADHDRGLPRLARDRPRQPPRLLQPPLRQAAAVRAALPAARGARADSPTTAASAQPLDLDAAARDRRRTSRPRASRRSRSACSTPTPTRATSRRCSSGCASCGRRSRSSRRTQITREWREYERTSTTVLSAYVQPVAERYLTRLADGVRDAGLRAASSTSCSRTPASTPSRRRRRSRSRWSSRAPRAASGARPSSAG